MVSPAKIQVRFADLDVMEHVNNAVYLSYFEMARVHYFREILGTEWDWKANGVLIVRNEIDYIQPILLNDEPEIHVFLHKIGSKSIHLKYEVWAKGTLRTTGASIMVSFDATKMQTTEVPLAMREALNRLEKR